MSYKLTEQANHTVEVAGNLEAEIVDRERQHIVRSIRQKARVPGFRDGRAPESVVRVRYAEEIKGELEEHLSQMVWREVTEGEESLQPLTAPQIRDLGYDGDGSFRLVAQLEVRPKYDLPDLADAELPEVSLDVGPDEVETELERLQDEQAVWEPVDDEAAADGMLVEVDLHGEMQGTDQDPYDENDARFVLGAGGVPAEVNEALQGARVGDERVAERSFPEDDEKRDRAGKTVRYTIKLKALKRKTLPDIDDELAKTIGLESLDELKERIHEALTRKKRGERRDLWRRALLDYLQAPIDVNELPSSLVQSSINESLNRFAYQMAMQGEAPEDGRFDWQELSAKAEPAARRQVVDTLVLEQLAGEWKVPVPEAEVDAYIAAEARQLGVPPAEHKATLAAEDRLDQIRHAARLTAVVDEMIRHAGGEVE
jgi:trigger factor